MRHLNWVGGGGVHYTVQWVRAALTERPDDKNAHTWVTNEIIIVPSVALSCPNLEVVFKFMRHRPAEARPILSLPFVPRRPLHGRV